MSVNKNNYSKEYLESVKSRFPDFSDTTDAQLVEVLDNNIKRIPGEYEQDMEKTFKEIEKDKILNYTDDKIFDYLFEELPQEFSAKIKSGMGYVINELWSWELVLWSWSEDSKWWWKQTVGAPDFLNTHNFVQSGKYEYFVPGDKDKFVVILWMNKNWKDDLWRTKFDMSTQLWEIPKIWSMVMKGKIFKKELNLEEFKDSLEKCEVRA